MASCRLWLPWTCLSVRPSVSLPVCLSPSVSVCPSVCLWWVLCAVSSGLRLADLSSYRRYFHSWSAEPVAWRKEINQSFSWPKNFLSFMKGKPLPYCEELPLIALLSLISTVTFVLILSSSLLFGFHGDLFSSLWVSGLKRCCSILLKSCSQHFDRLDDSALRSQLEFLRSNVQECLAVRLPSCCRYCALVRTDYADSDTSYGTWRRIVW